MMRPSPGWMTAMSSRESSRCPDQTVTSFSDFSSAMRKVPPGGRIHGRLRRAQACGGEREEKRRGLRERRPAAGKRVARGRVAQRLEAGAQEAEPDAAAPGDRTGHAAAMRKQQEEDQVAGGGVELERVPRRRPERREDDAPRERRRPSVAAAGEEAPDAADGEREETRRHDRVEQLAGRPPREARDGPRRGEARRHAARRSDDLRSTEDDAKCGQHAVVTASRGPRSAARQAAPRRSAPQRLVSRRNNPSRWPGGTADQPLFAAAWACWSAGVVGMPGTERCSRKAASKFFAISPAVQPPSL